MADANSRFPWWAAVAAGAGVFLLLIATILSFSAASFRDSDDFGSDPDDLRTANTMDRLAGLFMDVGRLAVGGAFIAAGALGVNPGYTRAIFAVVGAAVLFPMNII